MEEDSPTKSNKVTILSDIVLNPFRKKSPKGCLSPPVPPLVPLPGRNINLLEANIKNLSGTIENTKQNSILVPNKDLSKSNSVKEKPHKRKSVDVFSDQAVPKKPKVGLISTSDEENKSNSNDEERVFNYMTGTYEKVEKAELPNHAVYLETDSDVKYDLTLEENIIKDGDTSCAVPPLVTIESEAVTEATTKEDSKIKLSLSNVKVDGKKNVTKKDDKMPTETIDLTDDDVVEPNFTAQNNLFVSNVLALQNVLQTIVTPKSDTKSPLKSVIIQNPTPALKTLQGNVIVQNPISQNSAKLNANQNLPSAVTQPLVLMVHNNSTYLVPQNILLANNRLKSNVPGSVCLLPGNASVQNNAPSANVSNVTNFAFKTSPVKDSPQAPPKSDKSKRNSNVSPNGNRASPFSETSLDRSEPKTKNSPQNVGISSQNVNHSPNTSQKLIASLPFQILETSIDSEPKNSSQNLKQSPDTSQNLPSAVQVPKTSTSSNFSGPNKNNFPQNIVTSQNLPSPVPVQKTMSSLNLSAPKKNKSPPNIVTSQNFKNSSSISQKFSNLVDTQKTSNFSVPKQSTSPQNPIISQNLKNSLDISQKFSVPRQSNSLQNLITSQNLASPVPAVNTSTSLKPFVTKKNNSLEKLKKSANTLQKSISRLKNPLLIQQRLISNLNLSAPKKNKSQPFSIALQDESISSQNPADSSQNLDDSSLNLNCQSCTYKGSSRRDLILHIHSAHSEGENRLILRCKICSFHTEYTSVMEKHDLGHGNKPEDQEKLMNVSLSHNVEISIQKKPKKKTNTKIVNNSSDNIIDLADSDDEVIVENSKGAQYRCFDCNFTSSKKRSLQNHVVRHDQSKFHCSRHETITDGCEECIYQGCLSSLLKNMFQCTKCGYRTCRKQCFESHVKNHTIGGQSTEKNPFSSDSESENEHPNDFRCFHCSFVSKTMELLKSHAVTHIGDVFECDMHRSGNDTMCNRCVYSSILKDLQHEVILCGCGFKTLDQSEYERHKGNCRQYAAKDCQKKNGNVKGLKSTCSTKTKLNRNKPVENEDNVGDFKCFHCLYTCSSRDLLKCHAMEHLERQFDCHVHCNSLPDKCNECLYNNILVELGKEVLLCRDCGFKTLRQPTFERHKSQRENCDKYRKWLVQAADGSDAEVDVSNTNLKETISAFKQADLIMICAKCHYRTHDQNSFRLHEKSHFDGRFKCFQCARNCADDRETLKHHVAVAHYQKDFDCDKHSSLEPAPDCEKCIYSSVKQEAEKEVLICDQCSFKTLQKGLFDGHKCSGKKKVRNEDEDYVPDDISNFIAKVRSDIQNSIATVGEPPENLTFQCFDCGLVSARLRAFEKHVKTHPDSAFKCDHKIFDQNCKRCVYQYFVEKKSGKRTLSCQRCGYKSKSLDGMLTHVKTKCKNSRMKVSNIEFVECYDCGARLESKEALRNHAMGHKSEFECPTHKNDYRHECGKCLYELIGKDLRKPIFKCFDCTSKYHSELDLKGHVETKHKKSTFKCDKHDIAPMEKCEQCRYVRMVRSAKSDRIPCVVCAPNSVYTSSFLLKKHILKKHMGCKFKCLTHTRKKVYLECDKCLFEKLLVDIRFLSPNRFSCLDCPMKVHSKDQLEVHVRVRHEDSTFHCTKHSLGHIDDGCNMCIYESVVVSMNS